MSKKIHYNPINTTKLCECGCGQFTKVATKTKSSLGHRKGEPKRFINGHNGRGPLSTQWKGGKVIRKGYIMVHWKERSSDGRRGEHQIIAEAALGKRLLRGAEVHHVDGNRLNNSNDNLVICPSSTYHLLLHKRQRALHICGNANWIRCAVCRQYDDPANMVVSPRERDPYRMQHSSHAGLGIKWKSISSGAARPAQVR